MKMQNGMFLKAGILAGVYFSFLMPGVQAEYRTLENDWLEVVVPEEGEVLVEKLIYRPREFNNLRESTSGDSFLSFGGEGDSQVGIRVAIGKDTEYVQWKVESEEEHQIKLVAEDQKMQAVLQVYPELSALDIVLSGSGSVSENDALRLEMMLQVAGDFLGVPTEGPADYQIVPVQEGIGTRVDSIAIHRNTDVSYNLVQPWWAVADRASHFMLGCHVSGKDIVLEQWSGEIQTIDALRQTLVLKPAEATGGWEAKIRLLLLDKMEGLSGINEDVASWIMEVERDNKKTVVIAPAREFGKGTFTLSVEEEIFEIKTEAWTVGSVYRYELPEKLTNGKFPWKAKWKSEYSQGEMLIFQNAPPQL